MNKTDVRTLRSIKEKLDKMASKYEDNDADLVEGIGSVVSQLNLASQIIDSIIDGVE